MKEVTTEELINYKILPYNIYTEFGEKLFSAGETLTPGKLLQIKHLTNIFRDDVEQLDIIPEEKDNSSVKNPVSLKNDIGEVEHTKNDLDKIFEDYSKEELEKKRIIEVFNMNPNQVLKSNTIVDEINVLNYRGPINKKSKIEPQNQIKLKAFYHEIVSELNTRPFSETSNLFLNIRDKILQDIIYSHEKVIYSSQIKLIGEYQKCHSLNVAILSGFIAKKMDMSESNISDVVLAGLLHDIGKIQIKPEILEKQAPTKEEQGIIQAHTHTGYKMLKEKFKFPEKIALVAFEHHENNDGSGYPMNKSGDLISRESQIIHISNHFDNLTFNRTSHLIKNSKEAVRTMLELGSRYFMPEPLYTFAHMFSYDDTINFEDMIL